MQSRLFGWILGTVLAGSMLLGASPVLAQGGYGSGYGGYGGMMGPGGMMGGYGGYGPGAGAVQRVRLTISDDSIVPAEFSVPAGTMVVWANRGGSVHNITVPNAWDSGPISPGRSRGVLFATPGTYDYYDSSHPDIHGRLTVTSQ